MKKFIISIFFITLFSSAAYAEYSDFYNCYGIKDSDRVIIINNSKHDSVETAIRFKFTRYFRKHCSYVKLVDRLYIKTSAQESMLSMTLADPDNIKKLSGEVLDANYLIVVTRRDLSNTIGDITVIDLNTQEIVDIHDYYNYFQKNETHEGISY